MPIKRYLVTVEHDSGTTTLAVWTTDEANAILLVCAAEKCPLRAVKRVQLSA